MGRLVLLGLPAVLAAFIIAGFIAANFAQHVHATVLGSSVHVHRFTYMQPVFKSIRESRFKHLYMKCSNNLPGITSSEKLHYIGTLLVGPKYPQVSLYGAAGAGKPSLLVVYHVKDSVLWCSYADVAAVRHVEKGAIKLADNVQGRYEYWVYKARIPPPPPLVVAAWGVARYIKALTSSVTIYEYDVDGAIVYTFGSVGEYAVHLKGYVWVKEERNGAREVIGAEESGSYGERRGAMQYLFSECSFDAWAEYNEFAGFIKAKWVIAENVCPLPARYRGRPALKLDLDGTMHLDPGGPSGGNELGCGCYGWSP